mgnify:FL=1
MEYIKSWLKTILYMNILLLLCDNLMQKTAYEKYYHFFSGFLLVLCLLKPVIDFAGTEQYFYTSFLQEKWRNEKSMLRNSKELRNLEAEVKRESEAAYESQIKELAGKEGFCVKKITFRWDTEEEYIKRLEIRGSIKKAESEKIKTTVHIEKLKEIIMQLYNLEESDVNIEVE